MAVFQWSDLKEKTFHFFFIIKGGKNMKFDEDKIIQSIINRKQLKPRFSKNSNVYDSFTELEKTAFEDSDLSKKHKELMALSISIVIKCEPLNGMFSKPIWLVHL